MVNVMGTAVAMSRFNESCMFKFVTYNSIHLFMVHVHILCMHGECYQEEYLHRRIYIYKTTTPRCGMEISFGVV